MNSVKFIHTADLHLDSPFVGMNHLPDSIFSVVQESTFRSFERIVDKAIEKMVDFVILAGDIYDQHDRSLKAQLFFKKQMERLQAKQIPAYIIYGNHDFTSGSSLHIELPENVHVFSDQEVECKTFKRNGVPIANLYGFSYSKRAVTENMSSYYEKKGEAPFHIGILHGSLAGNGEHESYAPFRIQDLTEKGFDYWALGHIHKRQIVSEKFPTIIYPGNIQGRHRKEEGEKGAYYVELTETNATYEFFNTALIQFLQYEMKVDVYSSFQTFMDAAMELKEQIQRFHDRTFYTLRLVGSTALYHEFMKDEIMEDLIDFLNEGEGEEDEAFAWLLKVEREIMPEQTLLNDRDFLFTEDFQHVLQRYDVTEALEPFMKHSLTRRYLAPFSEEEKEAILSEAQSLLFHEWMKTYMK